MIFADLKNYSQTRKIIFVTTLILSLIPSIFITGHALFNSLMYFNPFLFLFELIIVLVLGVIGLIGYLFADRFKARKIRVTVFLIILFVSSSMSYYDIRQMKVKLFVMKNNAELEIIANNVLNKKMTIDQTKEILLDKFKIRDCIISEKSTVYFLFDGFLDNCEGIAYSETGDKEEYNEYGRIINWYWVNHNFYVWSTT